MQRYNPSEIEPKWQHVWQKQNTYRATDDTSKPKMYVSGMFPYPSGAGMHTGHAFSYTIVDAIARFHRAHGRNVLNPMGWDTFGLPAENYAIKTGTAPSEVTKTNIANFKEQFSRMGVSIDWPREINTSDPEYYRWTQWIFTEFFKRGLAYQKESLQWWCPVDKTVLANEQVEAGKCWRCGSEVVKKSMKQWFFKITDYADALLEEIPSLDWPEKIKSAQTNWIGRSEGAEIDFQLAEGNDSLKVFTTRPDTIFGATFMVVAPEHPLINMLKTDETAAAVDTYVSEALKKSEIERMSDTKEKTGVFSGGYAINPATDEKIPIWIADYVLSGYGTGAIMAVPAHDERDNEFAKKLELTVRQVVEPLYIQTDTESKVRDDEQFVERQAITAIVKDPESGKFMGLKWKEVDWDTFVTGGVEDGQTPEEAARAEVLEETGYKNLRLIKELPKTHAQFYHVPKGQNRFAHFHGFYFELENSEVMETSNDEQSKHDVVWLSPDEMQMFDLPASHRYLWDYIQGIGKLYHGEGILVNSGKFDGMQTSGVREEVVAWFEHEGVGKTKTTYKMRDWLISRQRYWGAPIPIIHCPDHGAVAVPDDQLPVVLPHVEDYAPKGDGKSILAEQTEWVNTTCPECGKPAKRETDTMDGYACSSWYLLRYTDPNNAEAAWNTELANYWSPVDFYVGGDHAVAHLLYVRFWTHVFNDMGLLNFKEPVKKLVYHGYVNAEDGRKMSKSLGNVVDPLDIINQGYGADTLRTYVLFMGPIELDSAWSSKGVAGVYRFLNRVWTLVQEYDAAEKKLSLPNDDLLERLRHKTIKKVSEDYHKLSFNTAIATMMEYVNEMYKLKLNGFSEDTWKNALESLVQLLGPIAPHVSSELWQQLGNDSTLDYKEWPNWDESQLIEATVTVVVQVNGKLRAKLELAKDASEEEATTVALANEHVRKFVGEQKPAKIVYVAGRLINIVV